MPDSISADRTAELLLWYLEEPGRYRAEGRRRGAPPLDSAVVLKLALGRRVDFSLATLNDAQTVAMLRDAAALYVRFLFFRPEATPYQILGLAPGASAEAVKENFRLLMHLVHPDRQDARVVWPDAFAAQANHAYGILRDQDARVKFDREAEARAAMARVMNRAASASVASKMPVVLRPHLRFGKAGMLGRALPEWLTTGVGGFVRDHPSATAFSALIAVAVLSVSAMIWETREEALTRDVEAASQRSDASPVVAETASASLSASARSASALPSGGTTAKRSALAEAKSSGVATSPVGVAPAAGVLPRGGGASQPVAAVAGDPRAPRTVSPAIAPVASQSVARNPPAESISIAGAPVAESIAPSVEPAPPPASPGTGASSGNVVAHSVVATASPGPSSAVSPATTMARAEPGAMAIVPPVPPPAPATSEIETLFATFIDSYERGRIDAFADLFDVEAEANQRQGRTAIRGEYDELFRLSQWRKMQLTRVNWKRVGNRAVAKGEVTVRIGWRDGREVEQRLAMDMELVRRDGRVVIARMSQQPRN